MPLLSWTWQTPWTNVAAVTPCGPQESCSSQRTCWGIEVPHWGNQAPHSLGPEGWELLRPVLGRWYCCPSRGKPFPFLHKPLRLLVLTSSSLVLCKYLGCHRDPFSQAQSSADLFSAPLSSSFSRRSRAQEQIKLSMSSLLRLKEILLISAVLKSWVPQRRTGN